MISQELVAEMTGCSLEDIYLKDEDCNPGVYKVFIDSEHKFWIKNSSSLRSSFLISPENRGMVERLYEFMINTAICHQETEVRLIPFKNNLSSLVIIAPNLKNINFPFKEKKFLKSHKEKMNLLNDFLPSKIPIDTDITYWFNWKTDGNDFFYIDSHVISRDCMDFVNEEYIF